MSKSFTGQETLQYMESLKRAGYTIRYTLSTESELRSLNGHSGGGFRREGTDIRIYINQSLNTNEQVHVIVHEMSHVKDDFEIDEVLKNYPHVQEATANFISSKGQGPFSYQVSQYVLGTLFCSEARAYFKNQSLHVEGTKTEYFAKGSELSTFIDQTYISRFGTSYGSSAEQMKIWCLGRGTMTQIQNSLVW